MECDTNMKATTKIDFDTNIFVLQLEGSPFGVDKFPYLGFLSSYLWDLTPWSG